VGRCRLRGRTESRQQRRLMPDCCRSIGRIIAEKKFLGVDIQSRCARIPASSEEKYPVSSPQMSAVISQTDFPGLKLRARGKVRDIYELGDRLLIVATDSFRL